MSHKNKATVIAIVGPTGSGKTALSLSVAETLNAEIIACDSRTVYKEFDIGTAKPSNAELNRVPHHLIDVVTPAENYTAADFATQGQAAIADITTRCKLPLVCGGTGFYARALLEGLAIPSVAPDEEVRAKLNAFADEHGNTALHQRLTEVDQPTAHKLNPNDRFRVIRALEVHHVLGKPISEVATKGEPPHNTIWIGLNFADRSYLHDKIKKRFTEQLEMGMLAETERLYAKYGASQKLLQTVNYKQLVQFIEGQLEQQAAYDEALRHNMQLARRQLIWFRANERIRWFEADRLSQAELINSVVSYIAQHS